MRYEQWKNHPKRLPDDVVDNCSLATQKRLKKEYANTVKEDNTMLYDILSSQDKEFHSQQENSSHFTSFENIA